MRSLMLALGACLFALNLAGCSGTCNSGCPSGGRILGGNLSASCGDCGRGCGDSACSSGLAQNSYGGQTGLGLGLMEAGPSCQAAGCNGGCSSCQRPLQQLGSRLAARRASCGSCGGAGDCGCGESGDTGESVEPSPATPTSDCGCGASAPIEFSVGDAGDSSGSEIQTVSHGGPGGVLGKLGIGRAHKIRSAGGGRIASHIGSGAGIGSHIGSGVGVGSHIGGGAGIGSHIGGGGCGIRGCGHGGLCQNCLSRLRGAYGPGSPGTVPHTDPSIHGGGGAGPAGQIPTYAYPYYTTRAPRDFLDPNPPTIGY